MIATLFQLKYLRSERRLGVSLVSMANVRMKVGYNFLYETSGLLHICVAIKIQKEELKKFSCYPSILDINIAVI